MTLREVAILYPSLNLHFIKTYMIGSFAVHSFWQLCIYKSRIIEIADDDRWRISVKSI